MDEEITEIEPELTELSVRYTGTSDARTMTQQDLSGAGGTIHEDHVLPDLNWTRGSVVPFSTWEEMAGSPERAREILSAHIHEFELVGPGAEDFDWDGEEEEEDVPNGDDGTQV